MELTARELLNHLFHTAIEEVDGEDEAHREQGFGLGHTELSLSSPIDDLFSGRLTAVFEEHDGESEVLIEEAYLQTNGLPYALNVRAGRFLSQVGYLNGRHMHEDDFVERPAAYRAMLGSHYYDTALFLAGRCGSLCW